MAEYQLGGGLRLLTAVEKTYGFAQFLHTRMVRALETEDPAAHRMHSEWYRIPEETAALIGDTRRAGDFTQAALWAQSKLDAAGLESMLEPGRTSGQFDDRFSWTLTIEEELVFDEPMDGAGAKVLVGVHVCLLYGPAVE
jgi:hypothetical protein